MCFYIDSQRYCDMEKNYQYFKCRSVVENKGGASGDTADRDHKDPKRVKNYRNFER